MTRDLEHQEQVALFNWAAYFTEKCPALGMTLAIPNGGLRNKAVAGKMKAEGVKAGVPDIFLPVPMRVDPGLFIEMKIKPNRTTQNQERWLRKLSERGYLCLVCYSWREAAKEICEYLELDPNEYGLENYK